MFKFTVIAILVLVFTIAGAVARPVIVGYVQGSAQALMAGDIPCCVQ